jgi:hypothetical protein
MRASIMEYLGMCPRQCDVLLVFRSELDPSAKYASLPYSSIVTDNWVPVTDEQELGVFLGGQIVIRYFLFEKTSY